MSSKHLERVQTIMFVRHGVAKHNLMNEQTGQPPDLTDPSLFDPPLVLTGKQQALEAGDLIQRWFQPQNLRVELVVSSPLTRCLQTATLAFLSGDNGYCAGAAEPTICVLDHVREAFGIHYPDKRRNKSLLMSEWPKMQWDPQMTELDESWKTSTRETCQDLVIRAEKFLQWCCQRSENQIVVVSHGVFIESCLNAFCPSALPDGQRVYNCDLYAGHLLSSGGKFQALQHVRLAYNRNWGGG